MAAMTGARRGELLGLHWRDIDLEAGRMAIHQSKTGTGIRSVALGAETVRVLRALRRRQAELRLALGRGYHDDGLVFCEEDGTPLRADGIGRRFQRAAKRAGVPVIRLHDARHTHATLSLAAGTHPEGRKRAARARQHGVHAGQVLREHPGHAGGCGGTRRGPRLRHRGRPLADGLQSAHPGLPVVRPKRRKPAIQADSRGRE